jgi:hypothetical protein
MKCSYLCPPFSGGTIAQQVEQRTENPCVPGSIPGGTTKRGLTGFILRALHPGARFLFPLRPKDFEENAI